MTVNQRSVSAYVAHADGLVRFASGLVGPSDAQDVVSDAMARLMGSRVWPEAENPKALTYRAVLYEARMFVRSQRRRLSREARAAIDGEYEMPNIAPEVSRAVAGLSPQQRAVVFLTYWDDLAPASVAALLGVSEGSVRKQLARARDRLREVLR
jgi:RNA polymerase sigma-70 factor (ECF subfamily)